VNITKCKNPLAKKNQKQLPHTTTSGRSTQHLGTTYRRTQHLGILSHIWAYCLTHYPSTPASSPFFGIFCDFLSILKFVCACLYTDRVPVKVIEDYLDKGLSPELYTKHRLQFADELYQVSYNLLLLLVPSRPPLCARRTLPSQLMPRGTAGGKRFRLFVQFLRKVGKENWHLTPVRRGNRVASCACAPFLVEFTAEAPVV